MLCTPIAHPLPMFEQGNSVVALFKHRGNGLRWENHLQLPKPLTDFEKRFGKVHWERVRQRQFNDAEVEPFLNLPLQKFSYQNKLK